LNDTSNLHFAEALWAGLRRRKLVQWSIAYVAAAWGLLQGLAYLRDTFAWPNQVQQAATVLLMLGVPVVLVLAWYHGDRGEQQVTRAELAILTFLFLAGGAVFWYFQHTADITAGTSSPGLSSPDIKSIAVLPLVNAGGNVELDYVSDGLTESIINALARLPDLSVKARSMVFRYKGREVEPQEVASALSVQSVVSGRMEQRGDNLTFSLALVNGDGDQIWGQRYESTMADLVSLQNEIVRDIARQLQARLSGADEQKVTKAYTSSGEAYRLYLEGRYHVQKVAASEVQQGIRYLEQATAIDPNYALAWVGIADAYRTASATDIQPSLVVPKAIEAAEKAAELDDSLGVAHAQLGVLAIWYEWDPARAEREFRRALELDPNNADARIYYAHLLSNQGKHDEALREAEAARSLEPLNTRFNALEGQFLIHAGRTDEALARLQAAIGLDPNHFLSHLFLATAYIEKGMYAEAIAEARRSVEITNRSVTHPLAVLGYALAKSGDEAQARAVLDELLTTARSRYVSPYGIALVYNALGDRDETLAWLERGYEARDHKMNLLKVDPKWANLHGDPQYEDIVRRIGF
jgi:TolB-like protein/Tfp pilus assembly protein PilF